jgi:hypothetical protein
VSPTVPAPAEPEPEPGAPLPSFNPLVVSFGDKSLSAEVLPLPLQALNNMPKEHTVIIINFFIQEILKFLTILILNSTNKHSRFFAA